MQLATQTLHFGSRLSSTPLGSTLHSLVVLPHFATMPDHVIPDSISSSPSQPASASPDSIFSAWWARVTNWWNIHPSLISYSQLPQVPDHRSPELEGETQDPTMEALRLSKARWRTYWLAVVLCCGGALFGYDSGVIGMYSCDPRYPFWLLLFLTFLQAVFSHSTPFNNHLNSLWMRRLGSAPLRLASSRLVH